MTAERRVRPVGTLLATGLGLFMIFLDATIVNVALPDIQADFGVDESGLQWVVAAYSLTMGMFMMSSASLADHRGRRRAYVAGIVLFGVASLACGLAPGIVTLNVARGVQGIGAAMVNVASLALVGSVFTDPAAKARAIGAWTGIAAIGLAIGPTLGGVMTEDLGWRSIFLVNLAIGVVAIALTYVFVGESKDPTVRRFDGGGQILFVVGIGSLTYALVQGPQAGWSSPLIIGLLVLTAAVTAAFVLTELRVRDPMMDVRVFRDRVYSVAIYTIFAALFGVYGTLLVTTQYFQNVRDLSAEEAGFLMLAFSIPTVVLSPITGRVVARAGSRLPALTGLVCLLVGQAVLSLGVGGPVTFTLVGLAFTGAAGALTVASVTSVAMTSIDPARSGMASGILSAQRALGSTAGFAIMGSVLAGVVAATLPGAFGADLDPAQAAEAAEVVVADANPNAVASIIGPGRPLPDAVAEEPELVAAADQAFVSGIRAANGVGFGVALSAFVAGWIVFPRRRSTEVADELAEVAALDADEREPDRDGPSPVA